MMLRNGVRAVGLGFSAWLLCLGTLAAQDASPADEPPFPPCAEESCPRLIDELNSLCSDSQCQACQPKAGACESADTSALNCVGCLGGARCSHAPSYSVTWHGYGFPEGRPDAGQWGAEDVLKLVWYGAPQVDEGSNTCGICRIGDCAACCEPLSALGYLWTECEATPAAGDLTVYCDGLNCTEPTNVEPGETAEVLLEIRSLVASNPLQGTAYQPMDSTSCARAQNAFVAGVRESAEACAAAAEVAAEAAPAPAYAATPVENPWQPTVRSPNSQAIAVMRQVSRELEACANKLEDAEMFRDADKLREQATELRHSARTAGGKWIQSPERHTSAWTATLQRENDELRAQVELLQAALRAGQLPAQSSTR